MCENRYHIRHNSTVQGAHGSDSWRGDIRKGRFPDIPAILFEQRVFPAVPCFDFAVALHFETDQPAICVMCFFPHEGYSGKRRRQDLHPSSSNKPKQCVCVCLFGLFVLFCFVCSFVCLCVYRLCRCKASVHPRGHRCDSGSCANEDGQMSE